jgi:glycosyltransferase involved in cell wall biosynthesis
MTISKSRKKLSVVVITLNEEEEIGACLEGVTWADEIVVVDSGSSDRTIEIAKKYTDKVIHHDWAGFGAQKNFAVDCAMHDWVLSLDADERVTPHLREEIQKLLSETPSCVAYRIARKNYFLGQWIRYAGWYPDYTIRLFHKKEGRFCEREVHETVQVNGVTAFLQHPLEHYTYRSLAAFHARMGRYAALAARQMVTEGRRFHVHDLLARPFWTFVRMYLLQQGFREGVSGLLLSSLYAYYTFFKYATLWELQRVKG